MKKLIIALLLIALTVIFFIPFKHQKTIQIKAQYFLVYEQLIKPNNWKNWQPDINRIWKKDSAAIQIVQHKAAFDLQAQNLTFNVDNSTGFAFTVNKKIGDKNSTYTFIAIPNNINATTVITLAERKNLLQLLYQSLSKNNAPDIDYLKKFIEDPRLYYGFDIRKTTVTDSNVIVVKKLISAKNKADEIAKISLELNNFIEKHHLKEVQPVIADIRKVGRDSLRMMIGIPINKQTVSDGNFVFMHLPTHGRMLVGYYSGRYGGREKLYMAMRSYITDHSLSTPEDAYEKYLDNKIPANDSSIVRLQVNFPGFLIVFE